MLAGAQQTLLMSSQQHYRSGSGSHDSSQSKGCGGLMSLDRTDFPVREQVGVLKARAVASACGIPLVPVHHMEAHALVARLTGSGDDPGVQG